MDSEKVIKRDNEYVLHTYNRNPIVLEKGHGLRAAGPEGQQYLKENSMPDFSLSFPCRFPESMSGESGMAGRSGADVVVS